MSERTVAARVKLRQNLVDHFNAEELELLCNDLSVDPESVPGRGGSKEYWAGEMIRYFERRGRLADLLAALQQRRPDVDWSDSGQSEAKPIPASSDSPAGAWWDHLSAQANDASRDAGVSGDVIVATIGAGATGVAVGKHISQRVQVSLGPATPSDPQLIEQALQQVSTALESASLDTMVRSMAGFQLGLLKGELLKPLDGAAPSANTITQVGAWLLQQAPALRPALDNLFGLPASGRVLARAGDAAVAWAQQAFATNARESAPKD